MSLQSALPRTIYEPGRRVIYSEGGSAYPLILADASKVCSTITFYNGKGEVQQGTATCLARVDQLIPEVIRSGVTIENIQGSLEPTPAPCATDGQVDCVVTSTYPAALAAGAAAKISLGQVAAGISGTAAPEAHIACTAALQSACATTATYPSIDLSLASATPDLTAAGLEAALASNSSFEFWDASGNRHLLSGDSDLVAANISAAVTVHGITGTASLESHAPCTGAKQSGCIATASYATQDVRTAGAAATLNPTNFASRLTSAANFEFWDALGAKHSLTGDPDLLASNIVNGFAIHGITGSAALEAHSACTASNQTACVTTALYPPMDLSLASTTPDLTATNFASSLASAATFEFWDSTGSRHTAAGDTDFVANQIENSIVVHGVTGTAVLEAHSPCTAANQTGCLTTSTLQSMDFSTADSSTDLATGNFNTAIATAANFEFWDSTGTRHLVAGDADLTPSNIKSAVVIHGTTGNVTAESHSSCTAAAQTACVATPSFKTMDTSLADGTTDLTAGSFAATIAAGANFEFWDATGARQVVAGDSDFVASNFAAGVTIHGVAGSLVTETHSPCTAANQSGCVATSTYQTMNVTVGGSDTGLTAGNFDASIRTASPFEFWNAGGVRQSLSGDSDLAAANIANGVEIHGVTGSATLESHSSCTAAAQSGCVATPTFQTMNITLADSTTDLTASTFNTTIATNANFEFWDSTGARSVVAGDSDLTAAKIKSGVVIFGVTGAYPSATYPLPSASATADLDNATFNAKIKAATAFEFWTSDGTYQTGAGDADISAASILLNTSIFGTTGSATGSSDCTTTVQATCEATPACRWSSGSCSIDPWNIRAGTTLSSVSGALTINCRNRINSAFFNSDTMPPGNVAITSGTLFDWWDTIDDETNLGPMPTTLVTGWLSATDCGTSAWLDVTADGACDSNADDCIFKDRISGVYWTELNPISGQASVRSDLNWSPAISLCNDLVYGSHSDWRVPTQKELNAAFIHGIKGLGYYGAGTQRPGGDTLINNSFFIPETNVDVWSATSSSASVTDTWRDYLDSGDSDAGNSKLNGNSVLCIR